MKTRIRDAIWVAVAILCYGFLCSLVVYAYVGQR